MSECLPGARSPLKHCYIIHCHTIVAGYYGIMLAVCLSFFPSVCCPSVRIFVRLSVFSFPDDNLNKYQWIFTKLGVCIDIVEIWFEIVNWQTSSIFDSYLPAICPYFYLWTKTLVNLNGFSLNLVCALILWRSALGLLMGRFCLFWSWV